MLSVGFQMVNPQHLFLMCKLHKTAAVLVVGMALSGGAAAQQQESFDSGIARIAESLTQPLVGRTVAVFEFPDLESRVTNLSRLVSEQLTTELVQRLIGRARVLERRQVIQVLTELDLLKTDLTAAEVTQVGRLLGADAILLGSATTIGDQIVVNVRAVAVTGGVVLAANRMGVQGSQHLLALANAGIDARPPTRVPDQGTPPTSTSAGTQSPNSPSRLRRSIGFVTVELVRCSQSGGTVTCNLVLNNTGADTRFTIDLGRETRMFDTAGNEYRSATGRVANQQSTYRTGATLVSGIATQASITFRQVAETARIPLLEIRAGTGHWETIQFRDVPMN